MWANWDGIKCPLFHFQFLSSARSNHQGWSAGPTSREPLGPGQHRWQPFCTWMGDMTMSLSQPPSWESSPCWQHLRETGTFLMKLKLTFPASWVNDFHHFDHWHPCPGPDGRATHWAKLGKQGNRKKKPVYLWSTVPQMLEFFQLEKWYTVWKNLLIKNSPGCRQRK